MLVKFAIKEFQEDREFRQISIIVGEDLRRAYRARELISLVVQIGPNSILPYQMISKTLDHIGMELMAI